MANNFQIARTQRRRIIKELEAQQKRDAKVAGDLRNSIIAISKELLQQISILLDSYGIDRQLSETERQIFAKISPGITLDCWLSARKRLAQSQMELEQRQEYLRKAKVNYVEVAPWGPFSRVLKNPAEKAVINSLLANRKQAEEALARITLECNLEKTEIAEKGENILRFAMTKTSLEYLAATPSLITAEVQRLLGRLADEVTSLWKRHADDQRESLRQVKTHEDQLVGVYSAPDFDLGNTGGK